MRSCLASRQEPDDVAFARVEVDVQRVLRHDRGQHGRARRPGRDEVPLGDRLPADPAGDRRRDPAEFQVQLRPSDRRLVGGDRGQGLVALGDGLVEVLAAEDAPVEQGRVPLVVGGGLADAGLVAGVLGLGQVQLGLERAGVDLEEEVALAHLRARGEGHLLEVAGDAGPDLDRIDRLEPPGEVVVRDDLAVERPGDRDQRRLGLRRLGGPRTVAAPGPDQGAQGRAERPDRVGSSHRVGLSGVGRRRACP